jgi:hypothetical protein
LLPPQVLQLLSPLITLSMLFTDLTPFYLPFFPHVFHRKKN